MRSVSFSILVFCSLPLTNKHIAVLVGAMWKNETSEIRAYYHSKALQLKTDLIAKIPGYRYSPRRSTQIVRRNIRKITISVYPGFSSHAHPDMRPTQYTLTESEEHQLRSEYPGIHKLKVMPGNKCQITIRVTANDSNRIDIIDNWVPAFARNSTATDVPQGSITTDVAENSVVAVAPQETLADNLHHLTTPAAPQETLANNIHHLTTPAAPQETSADNLHHSTTPAAPQETSADNLHHSTTQAAHQASTTNDATHDLDTDDDEDMMDAEMILPVGEAPDAPDALDTLDDGIVIENPTQDLFALNDALDEAAVADPLQSYDNWNDLLGTWTADDVSEFDYHEEIGHIVGGMALANMNNEAN